MGVRTYYLQSLAGEPFSFDLTSACKEFNSDKADWVGRRITKGIGEFKISLIMTIRTVVFDILATIKAAFKLVCVHYIFDRSSLKNFSFCVWNLAVADTALVLSLFVGTIVPSSRAFAKDIHKGDIYLPLFEQKETAADVEKRLS